MTKGFRSTEFWLTVFGLIAGVWLANQGVSDAVVLAIVAAGPGYGVGRGLAKGGGGG